MEIITSYMKMKITIAVSCACCLWRKVYEHISMEYVCLILGGRTTYGLITMKSEKFNRCMVLIFIPYECKYLNYNAIQNFRFSY